jgi:hypothetical protein
LNGRGEEDSRHKDKDDTSYCGNPLDAPTYYSLRFLHTVATRYHLVRRCDKAVIVNVACGWSTSALGIPLGLPGAPSLDFETWESTNPFPASDYSRQTPISPATQARSRIRRNRPPLGSDSGRHSGEEACRRRSEDLTLSRSHGEWHWCFLCAASIALWLLLSGG